MPDPITISTITPVVAPIIAPVAVVEAPVAAVTPPSVTQAVTPVTEVAPTAPQTVTETAPAATTALGEALDKAAPVVPPVVTETTVTDPNVPPVEAKTESTEGGQSEEPAPPPEYEPFKAPEGITLQAEKVTEFTKLLADLETKGKADHSLVQEFGQKAVDFHINEVKKVAEDLTKLYQNTWERQKVAWKEQFLADPEIGGKRWQSTVDSALTFVRTHGGTGEQQKEFRNLMESSGLGNHPVMIRILASAGRAMKEGEPLAASKPVQVQKSKTQTMYGKG